MMPIYISDSYLRNCNRTPLSGTILCNMAIIAIPSCSARNATRYTNILETLGAETRLLTPKDDGHRTIADMMVGVSGLMLPGGPDVDPALYGQEPDTQAGLEVNRALDDLDLGLLHHALEQDMPILAICRGMQLLNIACGGQLVQDLPGHRVEDRPDSSADPTEVLYHQIYLSPGSKAAAVIGMAGFFKVNSLHHQGLFEAQRSPRLMSTAYSVEDGLIEGLESPNHSWVIGLQCHPERQKEVPGIFANLFVAFQERADSYE